MLGHNESALLFRLIAAHVAELTRSFDEAALPVRAFLNGCGHSPTAPGPWRTAGRAPGRILLVAHSVVVTNFRENLMLPLDQWQPDGLLPAHVDAVLRPRRVEHLNAAEAGLGEHRLCLLDSPHRAKPGAAIGERHGHAVHQADAVVERRDRRRRWRI